MKREMAWRPIEDAPNHRTVLTQHREDLYPVPAYRFDDPDVWFRETEGPEDSFYGGGRHGQLYRKPTHFQELPAPPEGGQK